MFDDHLKVTLVDVQEKDDRNIRIKYEVDGKQEEQIVSSTVEGLSTESE
ncbi:hypothetical protein [Halobacillus sp. KGW1]|nr:hypothetical protein [Halobacillus sp. KGW1]